MSSREAILEALERARREAQNYEQQLREVDSARTTIATPNSTFSASNNFYSQTLPSHHQSADSMRNWREEHRRLLSPYPITAVCELFYEYRPT